MQVRSDRRYRFAVPTNELWAAISAVDRYHGWWPWLRRFDGGELAAGETWACVVQPPLPYTLRFSIHLEEVEPARFVTATIDGDIVGHASIDLGPVELGTELRLVSVLAPKSSALRAASRLAAPIVRFGHDWVLDTGLKQFERRALR